MPEGEDPLKLRIEGRFNAVSEADETNKTCNDAAL